MIVKFLSKLKEDLGRLFIYPKTHYYKDRSVDYESYWRKRRGSSSGSVLSSWQKQRADKVLDLIEQGSVVLDVGCGDGAVLNYLKKKADINGVGVDFSESELQKARDFGVKTIKMDINDFTKLDELPEVDYITGFEIIEHMSNSESFLYHISKKARKGLIFSVPNTGYYAHRLRLLFGRFPLQWVVHPGEHLRFWTVRDIRFWVKSVGFNLDKLLMYQGLPLLNKLLPSLFAQGIIIKISKNGK
ncbi:MAG: methyltransferase domain-containing protein [Parcubacteria group bacterium]|nr:methyltransferase domain-containing protein [Parcubacteria group bacterium]